jgi:ABC-2 type transport system ATP-binding protein
LLSITDDTIPVTVAAEMCLGTVVTSDESVLAARGILATEPSNIQFAEMADRAPSMSLCARDMVQRVGWVPAGRSVGEFVIQARQLVKTYGANAAVRGLDLDVTSGTLYGFLGPNGAGKTTTIRMLTGLLRPTSGTVEVAGVNVVRDPLEAKRRIGLVPDEPALFEKLSAHEFLRFVGDVYGVPPHQARRRASELLEMFDLSEAADRLIAGYSHGMRQKTALAAALLHEPQVLFLDEPTVGLDPASARLIKDILRSIVARGGTVFMATHILEIAQALCDRIGIIQDGRIIASGTVAELRAEARASESGSLEDVFLALTGSGEEHALAAYLQER